MAPTTVPHDPAPKKKRHAKLERSDDRAIARLSRKDLSNRKISELLGINHHTVGERRKKMGLARGRCFMIKDWKEIERLYVDQRLSLGTIAKRFGVNYEAIRSGLARRGVARRSLALDKKIKDWNEVAGLYVDQKLDLRAIAQRFGVSMKSIATNLLKRGVVMRSSQQALMDWKIEQDRMAKLGKKLAAGEVVTVGTDRVLTPKGGRPAETKKGARIDELANQYERANQDADWPAIQKQIAVEFTENTAINSLQRLRGRYLKRQG